MSITDYFADWMATNAVIYAPSQTYDPATGKVSTTYATTSSTITGIMYNRSAAERYYSERWAKDVTEVIACDWKDCATLAVTSRLQISGKMYAVDSVLNIAHQNEVGLIGLKEFA